MSVEGVAAAALEALDLPLVVLDDEQVCVWANPAANELLGYDDAGLAGLPFAQFVDPDSLAELDDRWNGALDVGGDAGHDGRFMHRDGTRLVVPFAFYPSIAPGRHLLSFGDVPAQPLHEAEVELRAQLIDQVDAAVVVVGDDRRVVVWNDAAARLYGVAREDAIGRIPDEIGIRIEAGEEEAERARVELEAGDRASVQVTVQRPDGTTVPVEAHGAPLRRADGSIVQYAYVVIDRSERVAREQLLQRRAQMQASVANLGREAMLDVDIDELMRRACEQLASVLELPFAKVLEIEPGAPDLTVRAAYGWEPEMVGAAHVSVYDSHVGYVLREEESVVLEDLETESRFQGTPALGEHSIRSGVAVIVAGPSAPFGVLAVHDTRPRTFDPHEVSFVESIANVLGAAIARERGRHLQERLERGQRLEAVGQLAGGIAHDFNNLLAVIVSSTDLALDELEGRRVRDDVLEIKRAADRAAELTRQLLVFSRREEIDLREHDVNAVIRETEEMLRRTLGEGIDLRTRLDAERPTVMIGDGQIAQVLINLSVNSRDAMPQGGLLSIETTNVEVEAGNEPSPDLRPGLYVCLAVADTGSGMPAAITEQALEPFFTTKAVGEGTGLGLASVYGIVTQANGRVAIYSEEGKGTVVRCYLPVSMTTTVATPDAPGPTEAAGAPRAALVMLVEDEDAVRRVTERLLKRGGHEVAGFAGPQEAIAALEAGAEPDILLTDVVMPGMSGAALAERVAELRPGLPVIFMSGYTGDVSARHGFEQGSHTLLEKPFTGAALIEAIERALGAAD